MRLRSPHFVFLLLLVCSVQNRESLALHLMAGAVSEPASNPQQQLEIKSAAAERNRPASPHTNPGKPVQQLDPASAVAHKAAWPMRRPALASTSVSSFTSLLRA